MANSRAATCDENAILHLFLFVVEMSFGAPNPWEVSAESATQWGWLQECINRPISLMI